MECFPILALPLTNGPYLLSGYAQERIDVGYRQASAECLQLDKGWAGSMLCAIQNSSDEYWDRFQVAQAI